MKAPLLLKHNIDALLQARRQTRHDLAVWVRQSTDSKKVDPWISHIFTRPDREFQLKYLDRIADFFGIAVYQLFQPGISPLTERRSGRDRRTGLDRRVSNREAQLRPARTPEMETVTPAERTHLLRWRRIGRSDRVAIEAMIDLALLRVQGAAAPAEPAAVNGPPAVPAPRTPRRRPV